MLKHCTFIFLITSLLAFASTIVSAIAEERGIVPVPIEKPKDQQVLVYKEGHTSEAEALKLYDKAYAVIIGIDSYKNLDYSRQLSYAVRDAKGVALTLEKNFKFHKIFTLYNEEASRDKIMDVLSGKMSEVSKEDSVFIFWAGHGYTEATQHGPLGYLIPFDGTLNTTDMHKNISMSTIKEDIAKRIPAKHVFFVMDSCYSGLLVADRGEEQARPKRNLDYLKEISREDVRQVLTAGTDQQTVLDGGPKGHSVFTGRFIEALERADDFITASEIGVAISEKVFSDAKARNHKQTPQYGKLFGLGDYVFIPSPEKKEEDLLASIASLEDDLERLKNLEQAAERTKDERARRQAELEKRAVMAMLKAEQLRQNALQEDLERKRQAEADMKTARLERSRQQKEDQARLRALQEKVKTTRDRLDDSLTALSPQATLQEIKDLNSKIEEIRLAFATEQATRQQLARARYKINLTTEPKDEFEAQVEYLSRVAAAKEKVERGLIQELGRIESEIQDELNVQLSPFAEAMNKLVNNEFVLTLDGLKLEVHTYNPEHNDFPITITPRQSGKGLIGSLRYYLPLSRKEARLFRQHYTSKLLRPEIIGRYDSVGTFQIKRALVIDDAVDKKYRLKKFYPKVVLDSSGCSVLSTNGGRSLIPKSTVGCMVKIPGGQFVMGGTIVDEVPKHTVLIDTFHMDKYEVTQGEYKRVMGKNPSDFKGRNFPVVEVSWHDADAYCKKVGKRLPTEAEWEYAARAGTSTRYYWGDEIDGGYAWYNSDYRSMTHPVGEKKPNQFGLYDIAGNVWEWVADWYDGNYYRTASRNNPQGPSSGKQKVLRGGSWSFGTNHLQSASRSRFDPSIQFDDIGFRCASSSDRIARLESKVLPGIVTVSSIMPIAFDLNDVRVFSFMIKVTLDNDASAKVMKSSMPLFEGITVQTFEKFLKNKFYNDILYPKKKLLKRLKSAYHKKLEGVGGVEEIMFKEFLIQ